MLTVDGGAAGDASNALQFLRSVPLKHYIGSYLDGLEAAGATDTSLHLVLPVEDLNKFELHGVANLRGASFAPKGVPSAALDRLEGALSFDRNGIATRGVDGMFLGGPVHIVIQPGKGRLADTAEFIATGSAEAQALMELSKPVPASWASGATRWRLDGRVPNAPATSTNGFSVSLRSDLRGLAINLPTPLAKQADDTLPLVFEIKLADEHTLVFTAVYGDGVDAKLDFLRNGNGWSFDRGNLHLGEGAALLPATPGFMLTGTLDEFSWYDWKPFVPPTATAPAAEAPKSGGAMLHRPPCRVQT